jgi:hypothetical protein
MKDREYYERLISDSLDRPLTPSEESELEQAMRVYPELAEFKKTLTTQAELVRSLPEQKARGVLNQPAVTPKRQHGFLRSLWNIRVTVPLPVAVVVVLALIGFALFSSFRVGTSEEPVITRPATAIEYVQIERLKPAAAVLVPRDKQTRRTQKEAL